MEDWNLAYQVHYFKEEREAEHTNNQPDTHTELSLHFNLIMQSDIMYTSH